MHMMNSHSDGMMINMLHLSLFLAWNQNKLYTPEKKPLGIKIEMELHQWLDVSLLPY